MGNDVSRIRLEPAEEVEEGPYELRSIKAPRLTGTTLQFVVWLLESAFSGPIWVKSMRDSGIPQAVRDIDLPEPATYKPYWLQRSSTTSKEEVVVEDKPVQERLELASQAIPGFATQLNGRLSDEHRGHSSALEHRWTISDFAEAYTRGLTTPSEVAQRIINLIWEQDSCDPPMRMILAHIPDDLRKQAAASTARYKQGKPLSILDGVPYTVIDGIDALPYGTTAGTTFMHKHRPVTGTAPSIQQLAASGALLIGKSNLHEIGVGMTGLNTRHGTTRNPYDPGCYTGGSSSGSAAAVSSGLCPFALGIDGGGSVRVPSALCGVVGLRPTVGRTSTVNCPENAFSIMSFGTHTTCVADAMLVYGVIANAGTELATPRPAPLRVPSQLFDDRPAAAELLMPLKGRRVGVYKQLFEDASPEVVSACRNAVDLLREHGCEVVPICVPDLELVRVAQILTISSEMCQAYKFAMANSKLRKQFNLETRVSLAAAARFTATDYLQAQKIRTRLMTHYTRIFYEKDIDYVATPTTGTTAPTIREDALAVGETDLTQTGELMRFTISANMAGIPAISVPVGHCHKGLPIGLQLMGRPWEEASLLYVSSVLESAVKPLMRMPAVSYNLLTSQH